MHLLAVLLRRQGAAGAVTPPPGSGGGNNGTPTSVLIKTNAAATPTSTIPTVLTPTASLTASATPAGSGKNTNIVIAIVTTLAVVLIFLGIFFVLRRTRRKHKYPKYVPTSFLKKLWEKWEPDPQHWRLPRNNEHFEPISTRQSRLGPPASFDTAARNAVPATDNETGDIGTAGVDRRASVRSVMTLPAYRTHAQQNEQVLGREGDRGGIDVVIEFPENNNEEEQRREEEMEALYQVRLARRRENEERDERRRLRREARDRGDFVALRELQARARATSAASAGQSVEELRAEHSRIKKERQRAVSSVAYGDLGVARHDGTRLRANSEESERHGLLGDAASIAASSRYHRRDHSASSVLSIDTMNSDLPSLGFTRSRGNSRAEGPESPLRRGSTQTQGYSTENEGRAGSSPEIIDQGDGDIPPNSPPGYENISLDTPQNENPPSHHQEPPPDYTSPISTRGERATMIEGGLATGEGRPSVDRTISASGRRTSSTHIAQLMSDRRMSNSSNAGSGDLQVQRNPMGERRISSGRGVGGIPQLPSLRFSNLPSIQLDPGSPQVGRGEGRNPQS